MMDKLLVPFFEKAGNVIINNASSFGKTISEHFIKHGGKYAIGGGAAVIGGTAYAVGESVGHKRGKKEGTREQAARDEKKMNDLHQRHENDRRRWSKIEREYKDLLDEFENK